MKLIIGLGNIEHPGTRHNVGFDTLDAIHSNVPWKEVGGCLTKYVERLDAMLVKPVDGNMNSSGEALVSAFNNLKATADSVIVIYDDMDFQPGELKIKVGGGDGRHNGVKSLIKHIGADFIRVRVGIGKPKTKDEGLYFVLGTFTGPERKLIDQAIEQAAGAVEVIVKNGVQSAMSFFNQKGSK